MFDNRKDPMIDTVQKVMVENARRRQIEADLNEELGIQDRKQLGHEKHYLYDQALSQRINEAELSPKQKSLAAIGGNPEKIDASDFDKLRDMKNEANEEPPGPFDPIRIKRLPFDPDPPRKKRPDEPKTAKGLAKQAMRDMIAKADKAKPKQNMEEEQIDEERKRTSVVSSAFFAGKPAKQKELQTNGQEMTYHGNVIAKHAGDEVHVTTAGYGHSPSTRGHINGVLNRLGAPGLSQKKGKLMHGDTEVGTRDWIKIKKPTATMSEEQIDELSKKTLGSYIKKASHDAATKSAATGRYAERANKVKDETKKGDYSNYQQGKKDDATADKMFGKSWKRRKFIAKAVDKLTNEDLSLESIQEEIRNNLLERANHLLENGSQDQIVEFMNDLTLEQRSILNMQEINLNDLGADIGQGVVQGAKDVYRGGSKFINGLWNGAQSTPNNVKTLNVKPLPSTVPTLPNSYNAQYNKNQDILAPVTTEPAPPATAATKPATPPAPAPSTAATKPATPDISSGDESAGLNMNTPNYGPNKPATQQQAPKPQQPSVRPRPAPSPVSTADTGGDKYGSGNASAGFERGKYAAPDASDNSSASNELRAKQAAADRGNLEESKTKYMSESTLIRNLLRNR